MYQFVVLLFITTIYSDDRIKAEKRKNQANSIILCSRSHARAHTYVRVYRFVCIQRQIVILACVICAHMCFIAGYVNHTHTKCTQLAPQCTKTGLFLALQKSFRASGYGGCPLMEDERVNKFECPCVCVWVGIWYDDHTKLQYGHGQCILQHECTHLNTIGSMSLQHNFYVLKLSDARWKTSSRSDQTQYGKSQPRRHTHWNKFRHARETVYFARQYCYRCIRSKTTTMPSTTSSRSITLNTMLVCVPDLGQFHLLRQLYDYNFYWQEDNWGQSKQRSASRLIRVRGSRILAITARVKYAEDEIWLQSK